MDQKIVQFQVVEGAERLRDAIYVLTESGELYLMVIGTRKWIKQQGPAHKTHDIEPAETA